MPQKSNNTDDTIYMFVDYYQNNLWGGWFSEHSWWARAVNKLPNIMHLNPTHVCQSAREFMKMHGRKVEFVFSDAVRFLHEVESRTIQ